MNRKGIADQARILNCLCEGVGVNATSRMTGTAKNTILKLLADVGEACLAYQDEHMRNLPCKRLEIDEIWSFCYSKRANVPHDKQGKFGFGDVWVYVAMDADTKLVPSWLAAERLGRNTRLFIADLATRMSDEGRIQITTDGNTDYVRAIKSNFGVHADFAQLIKVFGPARPEVNPSAHKYSPPQVNGTHKQVVTGNPDTSLISTSYIERQNLSMRMHMRRFTRLTNAHSKKVQNHIHALALYYQFYNYVRTHNTLGKGITPAMAAGLAPYQWTFEDVAALVPPPTVIRN